MLRSKVETFHNSCWIRSVNVVDNWHTKCQVHNKYWIVTHLFNINWVLLAPTLNGGCCWVDPELSGLPPKDNGAIVWPFVNLTLLWACVHLSHRSSLHSWQWAIAECLSSQDSQKIDSFPLVVKPENFVKMKINDFLNWSLNLNLLRILDCFYI